MIVYVSNSNSLPLLVHFLFFGVRSNILTSIILLTEEQLCHGRGDHVTIASCVTHFFSKNSPQKNKYNHEKII